MKRHSKRIPLCLALLALLALTATSTSTQASTPGFVESWYLSRGRSNLSIGNYKAAIEAYEKVLEKSPDNREAMRNLGVAYERQGLKDKAVEQFDHYLEKNPRDAEIAFRQADTLGWSRYSYRRKDALRYYEMGLKQKDDTSERLKYARLLSENRETSAEAIRQYEKVLAKDPHNVQAHSGLARAYAWNGYNDKAIDHADLAMLYGHTRTDVSGVRRDLMKGREPSIAGNFAFSSQSGTGFELSGFTSSLRGHKDASPFVTLQAEAGIENFWDPSASQMGPFFSGGLQYRLDPNQHVNGQIGYHSLGGTGGAANIVFDLQYGYEEGQSAIRPGIRRELVTDTLQTLAGPALARSNLAYTEIEFPVGYAELKITPYVGWVSTSSLSPNAKMGADVRAELPLVDRNGIEASAIYQAQISHYGTDQSALAGGGYFSPRFFLNQVPAASLKFIFSPRSELGLLAGPAFQIVDDHSSSTQGTFRIGAEAQAAYQQRLAERFSWNVSGGFNQVAQVYNRFQVGTGLTLLF